MRITLHQAPWPIMSVNPSKSNLFPWMVSQKLLSQAKLLKHRVFLLIIFPPFSFLIFPSIVVVEASEGVSASRSQ